MNSAPTKELAQPHSPPAAHPGAGAGFFAVFGGPTAWFLQLCAGYALASKPCFNVGDRLAVPLSRLNWTGPAMVAALLAGVLIALLAMAASWRGFAQSRAEAEGDAAQIMEGGEGRVRFLSLWGVILGCGFALATAITAVAFITVPRCAG